MNPSLPSTDVNDARRAFLKTGGSLVVSFAFGSNLASAAPMPDPGSDRAKSVALDQVDGFLSIDAKGIVTVYSGKVDLGTGVRTAMTQIAAEELSVPIDHVFVIQGDTLLTPDQGVTYGSLSVQVGGMQIRQAADLLKTKAKPSEDEIKQALANNLCRCGTHVRIVRAIQRASETTAT